jgi:single-strand DNA-binding protein
MSMNMNQYQAVGNLTKDPELRHTSDLTPVVEFSLGVNERSFFEGKEHKSVTFVQCQLWGKSAENFVRLAEKGDEIFISGPLRQSTWKDRETGEQRSRMYVRIDSWQLTQHLEKEHAAERGQDVDRDVAPNHRQAHEVEQEQESGIEL